MISFFRKFRQDLMEKNKVGKYFKYAIGEILLVVLGILIALWINNWNEERKDKQQAENYLDRVESDLIELIDKSSNLISQNREILIAITKTQSLLERGTSLSESEKEIVSYAFLWFPRTTYSLPHMITYEEMKESGRINLIYEQKLRTQLAEYYNYLNQIEAIYIRLGGDIEDQFEVYNRYIKSTTDPESLEIIYEYDFKGMASDPEFINTFSRMVLHWRGFVFFMEGVNQRGKILVEEHFLKEN